MHDTTLLLLLWNEKEKGRRIGEEEGGPHPGTRKICTARSPYFGPESLEAPFAR